MYPFREKVAVVTGAAQGIGAAVALRLADEGVNLVLADIKPAEETALAARAKGVRALIVRTDVRERAQVQDLMDKALAEFGQIDQLVNVAGVGICNALVDVTDEDWDRTMDINAKGTFLTCQLIGQYMAKRRQGRIVNISSIAGKSGSENLVPYCASKGAVIVLTQSMAKALGPAGINVNAVCPGLVWTPMWRSTATWISNNSPAYAGKEVTPEEVYENAVMLSTPLRKPTTPEDIAATVAFLLSDEAKMITGQAINVCGGIQVH